MFYALHCIHHSRRPGTIWLPVGLSDWLLWSCQPDCLSHLYVCRVIRLTAIKLSCWLPYSWANQCCPVHMTHDSTMTTTAPVLRNRSREWFSQQANGPLQQFALGCWINGLPPHQDIPQYSYEITVYDISYHSWYVLYLFTAFLKYSSENVVRCLGCAIKANINIIIIDHVFKLMNVRSDPYLPCSSILMENMLPRINMLVCKVYLNISEYNMYGTVYISQLSIQIKTTTPCSNEILDFAIVEQGIELCVKQGITDTGICTAVYSCFYWNNTALYFC